MWHEQMIKKCVEIPRHVITRVNNILLFNCLICQIDIGEV